MIEPTIPKNEKERLSALKEYSILDSLPEKEYNDITYLASYICNTPISLVSLIDADRQWFKANHGLEAQEAPRNIAFCAHAINNKNEPLIVPDSRNDIRFKDNPLVTSNPNVIFYAGIPIINPDGYPLGTLCVIDTKPRELSEKQLKALNMLSNQLLKLLELRKSTVSLSSSIKLLNVNNKKLNEFVQVAAHDIKSPMASISMASELVLEEYSSALDAEGKRLMTYIKQSTSHLCELVEGILKNSKNSNIINANKEDLNIKETIETIISLLDSKGEVIFNVSVSKDLNVFCNKTALHQILVNLISNSIKYNDKDKAEINIKLIEEKECLTFNISDNGPGIKEADKEKIFDLFTTTSNKDKHGFHGTGIGLATVKSLVESLGGTITVQSIFGKGANFKFTLKKYQNDLK